mgnify:CR=1 FL=1|tara:strand:+ start:382 stop:819 length:438 start_codon:yes stop_codon:yes gene_type:complete
MAVTYKNVWKNINLALKSKLRAEMKCPVFSGFDTISKANQFIKLIPTGSEQGDVTKFSEHRTFNMDIQYYMLNRNNTQFQDYVFNQVSILEALVHDNPTLSLADSTTAYNVMIGDLELGVEPDEEFEDYFIAAWSFSCEHLSNLG